jgi:hypothetical protein
MCFEFEDIKQEKEEMQDADMTNPEENLIQ